MVSEHQNKSTSLSGGEIHKTLTQLDILIKRSKGYIDIASKLNYTYSYIHQIANRRLPPSAPFAKAVAKEYNRPKKKRFRMLVEFKTLEDLDEAKKRPMDERVRRLLG